MCLSLLFKHSLVIFEKKKKIPRFSFPFQLTSMFMCKNILGSEKQFLLFMEP